jgi:hypothetical protein
MHLVDAGYRFEAAVYPEVAHSDFEKFGVGHSVLHMMKSVGVIAGEVERFEHGGSMNRDALVAAVNKMLVNTLKLGAHLGMTGDDMAEYVHTKYGIQTAEETA